MKNFVFSDNFHQIIYIIPAPSTPAPRPLYPRPPPPLSPPPLTPLPPLPLSTRPYVTTVTALGRLCKHVGQITVCL